jgi:hypothetical protein
MTKAHQKGFRILEFDNRAGSTSYRVTGWLHGRRIRENFDSLPAAEARRLELDIERVGHKTQETLRATWLSAEQLAAAEAAFLAVPDPAEFTRAIGWWRDRGKREQQATQHAGGTTLDKAVTRFTEWLKDDKSMRGATTRNLKYRVEMFASETGDVELSALTPELIEGWLDGRKVGPVTKCNDLRAIHRFLGWCCERRQRYITTNPAASVKVALPEKGPPEIYNIRQVCRILATARRFRDRRFLKGIVLQLFGGLRPTEALRFTDEQVRDGCLRIPSAHSKTRDGRVIDIDPVLAAWLALCPEGPVSDPQNSKLLWRQFKEQARLERWIQDGLRHTAVSHYFRKTGSFGLCAEWAGNSEAVIREHYKARTTAAETATYWNLYPDRKARIRARKGTSHA